MIIRSLNKLNRGNFMMEQKKNTRCTQIQIQLLQKYMANNKTIATNTTKSLLSTMERNRRAREWSALRALLRKHGPDKPVEKWKQTWRDLKRKHKKIKSGANGVKIEKKNSVEKKCDITNDSDSTTLEPSTVYLDPLESIGEVVPLIKEEPSMSPVEIELPSIDVNLDIPYASPMQVVLTNTESFAPTSSTATQTSSNLLSSAHTSNPPFSCSHLNENHSHTQCCHQNIQLEAVSRTNSLQSQQNALLQRLCNLLEEQNSNLWMRNRIERSKIRFRHFRR